jgi:hypothetical protein
MYGAEQGQAGWRAGVLLTASATERPETTPYRVVRRVPWPYRCEADFVFDLWTVLPLA